jgi:hypothetical protein
MDTIMDTIFESNRKRFHQQLLDSVLTIDPEGIPSIADRGQKFSKLVSTLLMPKLGESNEANKSSGQHSGHAFEGICLNFIQSSFDNLEHLRKGKWKCSHVTNRKSGISGFEQYRHLHELKELSVQHPDLATALGNEYAIAPDIIISREPFEDEEINQYDHLVDNRVSQLTPFRKANNDTSLLLASISCKWTLRSDRAQNARSEALNLIRNRKGRCPHIMVVTAEPTPSRIASLALGTGDLDCVYHFALKELREAIQESDNDEALQLLDIMINGKRLRDIADLPLDLLA